jgi:hypothetical protein
MKLSLAELLESHVRRAQLPVSRIADLAGIPRQTLFNWLNGRNPRWHARLPADLARLGQVLKLDDDELEELLFAGGCACSRDADAPETNNMDTFCLPHGWIRAGSHPDEFAMGLDPQLAYRESPAGTLRSKRAASVKGFGTLMQSFRADRFRGRRVRFAAFTRCAGISEGWAGMWMRVDGTRQGNSLSFDNMQNRPLKGDMDWQQHAVVLDVPEESTGIALGLLLGGSGQVWIAGATFEVVGPECATTDLHAAMPHEPQNLGFDEAESAGG